METYGIGGTEVKGDASEAVADIPQNRTLMIEKLTAEPPVKPQIVEGLTTIDDVFNQFKPAVDVEFEDTEGRSKEEQLSFRGLADFGTKGIVAQSKFLQDLTMQKDQYLKIIKQLKSNKLLRKALENPESRQAVLNAIYAMSKEIEQA
jgi:predicted component of type VI protein secretion system